MRYFPTIEEAASEINRDIAKSPIITSSRVQSIIHEAKLHEALDYSYSVGDIPREVGTIVSLGHKWGFYKADELQAMVGWLKYERDLRLNWRSGEFAENHHPHLSIFTADGLRDDREPDYTYTDRLRGSIGGLSDLFADSPDTRRGFWPIFQPEDAVRSVRAVRIPCSLGYQLLMREVNGIPTLHLTYMERACDFKKFWLSDIWLAREFQHEVVRQIKHKASWPGFNELVCGNTTHFITSLHSFVDDEVY